MRVAVQIILALVEIAHKGSFSCARAEKQLSMDRTHLYGYVTCAC